MSSAERWQRLVAILLLLGVAAPAGSPALAAQPPTSSLRVELRLPSGHPSFRLPLQAGLGTRGYGLQWAVDFDAARRLLAPPPTLTRSLFLTRVWAGELSLRGVDRRTVVAVLRRLREDR